MTNAEWMIKNGYIVSPADGKSLYFKFFANTGFRNLELNKKYKLWGLLGE